MSDLQIAEKESKGHVLFKIVDVKTLAIRIAAATQGS